MIESRREGFALAATLLAMLVVGAVVTGGFYAASQESQVARSNGSADDAMYVAETGLNQALAQMTRVQLEAIPLNTTVTASPGNVNAGGTVLGNYTNTITRVAPALFVYRTTGTVTRGGRYAGANRTLASMVRLRDMDFDAQTAVQIYGSMDVAGSAYINGFDSYPAYWATESCSITSSTSAITTTPGSTIKRTGAAATIDGPTTRQQMDATDFTVFGDVTWDDLVAMREKTYPAGTTTNPAAVWSGTTCTIAAPENWGSPTDPLNPCFKYMPIIYAEGDLVVSSSNEGQGILLVNGDLTFAGGFEFFGVVVVKGDISIDGTSGHITGTTLVYGNGQFDSWSTTTGNSSVEYSSCAIRRAVLYNQNLARGFPIAHRSWLDVSAIRGGN